MAVTPISLKREVWGPCAWKILHTFAEASGKLQDSVLQKQEAETWVTLLTNLRDAMPCELCRKHYGEYIAKANPKDLLGLRGTELALKLQNWLFTLHSAVNTRNQKVSEIQTLEDCKAYYANQSIDTELKTLFHIFDFAVLKAKALPLNVRNTKMAMVRLRGLYGL